MRAVIFAVAACLGALGLAAPASATITTSITNGTAKVTGDGASDKIAVGVASATAIGIDIGADGTFDTGFELFDFSNLEIDMGGGDDTVDLSPLISTFGQIRPTVVDGGDGNDQLIGSNGPETLQGGAGDDIVDPKMGPDTASGGPGDDTFLWVPGDGNDKIDGDDGADTLSFSGSDANEALTVTPNGNRVTLRRDVDNVTMDLGSLEQLSLPTLGGSDSVIAANGIAPLQLDVAAGAGDDVFSGGDEVDRFDGGAGQDVANAGAGNDTLAGGDGNDLLVGDVGDDTISGDAGDDQLSGGDGTDHLDGGAGTDQIHCGGPGDTVVFDATDLIAGDCLPFPAPPPPPQPAPPPPVTTTVPGPTVTTTNTVTTTTAAPSPPSPSLPVVPTPAAPADARGFATPKVKLAGAGLKVTVANTADQPIRISVTASARAGHRRVRFGRASATLAAGQSRTVTLHASRKALGGHRVTHPVVTVRNVDTGGTLTLRPRP